MVTLRVGDSHDQTLWPTGRHGQTKVLLTDPPYGVDTAWRRGWHGTNGTSTLRDGVIPDWDRTTIDATLIDALVDWADIAVIFGGNFYSLAPAPCWFIWDKMQSNRGSDAEMAWTNAKVKGVKVFRMSRIDAYFNKRRFVKVHIAEKPVQLFEWCLSVLKVENALVFDPFMGTGNSGVAALESGHDYVGIDINLRYVAEAESRMRTVK